jgi:hypothetical protein
MVFLMQTMYFLMNMPLHREVLKMELLIFITLTVIQNASLIAG